MYLIFEVIKLIQCSEKGKYQDT